MQETDNFLRRGLKLSHLRLLAALSDTGQLSLAAARMGVAQPAASRLLAEVERITGQPVHTRTGRGLTLTPMGQALAHRATRVVTELRDAEEMTKKNTTMTLQMCVNYGGRLELVDAVRLIADDAASGKLNPARITEKTIQQHLYAPNLPDVDLFIRSSGEQRTSNFLLWQSAYSEMVFQNTLWPDYSRQNLWDAVESFMERDRRFGGAVDKPTAR